VILNQRDPKWAKNGLGTCNPQTTTIGSDGCLITVVSEINNTTPDIVNQKLTANGGYTSGCLMWLDVKARVQEYKSLVYVSDNFRDVPVPDAVIAKAQSVIDNGGGIVGQVTLAGGTHFIRIMKFFGNGLHSNAIIHDPWTGEEMAITDKYGKTAPIALIRLFGYSDVVTRDMTDYSHLVQNPLHGV